MLFIGSHSVIELTNHSVIELINEELFYFDLLWTADSHSDLP
jgi:hypothetical protein